MSLAINVVYSVSFIKIFLGTGMHMLGMTTGQDLNTCPRTSNDKKGDNTE